MLHVVDQCASIHCVWHACWTASALSMAQFLCCACLYILSHILWPEVLTFWWRSCAYSYSIFCMCTRSGSPHNVMHLSSSVKWWISLSTLLTSDRTLMEEHNQWYSLTNPQTKISQSNLHLLQAYKTRTLVARTMCEPTLWVLLCCPTLFDSGACRCQYWVPQPTILMRVWSVYLVETVPECYQTCSSIITHTYWYGGLQPRIAAVLDPD